MRLRRWVALALLTLCPGAASGQRASTAATVGTPSAHGEWPTYGGTLASARYSPLDQITRDNVGDLRVAWRWESPDQALMAKVPALGTHAYESTPIMVDGVLYVSTSISQVAAIEATTGRPLWVHDPQIWVHGTPSNHGYVHRGVASWKAGDDARIFIGTGNAFLVALDARTGTPIESFGDRGRIDLTEGLGRRVDRRWYSVTSPPLVIGDAVIVGSSIQDWPARVDMPPGHVRAFDPRTGKVLWMFHSIPRRGEFGADTWDFAARERFGGVNVWTAMSADEELGYVYLPFSTPANDYYGGERHGDNLFAESLVCVEAATGRRVWHFQMVRHGLWDYDLPAAPNLVDVVVDGRRVRAVAQVSKQGFVYVFDRVTGAPVWPIEERPVPRSRVSGEKTARSQPFPTRPAAFERQGVRADDLIDFTTELRDQALAILRNYDHGPLFTPPSERGTITLPSVVGGASWSGAAFDPESGRLYVTSVTAPYVVTLSRLPAEGSVPDRYVGRFRKLAGPRGLPLFKPPFGRVTAIDLHTGAHVWVAPVGEGPRYHPAIASLNLPRLGWDRRSFPLVTRTLLFVAQEPQRVASRPAVDRPGVSIPVYATDDPALQVFDKATGALIARVELPENATGALMTYLAGGKQYIVVPIGGGNIPAELVALSLP